MEILFLGIDGQYIPRDQIPFDFRYLNDGDMIEGDNGEQLVYLKDDKAYRLVTNEPHLRFLSTPYQNWRKL